MVARCYITSKQYAILEAYYQRSNYVENSYEREKLATQLKISAKQVMVWFRHRRTKDRKLGMSKDEDYLKAYRNHLFERFPRPIPPLVTILGPNNPIMPPIQLQNYAIPISQTVPFMPSIMQRAECK